MSPAALPPRLRGTPMLVLSSLIFALMAFCARLTAGRIGTGQLVCARFLMGLAFLAVYFGGRRQRPRFGRPWLWAARGLFGGAAVFLYFLAIDRLAVGPATLLNCLWPLWAALFSLVFLRERVSSHLGAGLVLTTVGAGLVIWSTVRTGVALTVGLGAWAGIASAVLSGAAVTVVRALRSDTDAPTVFLSFNLFGFLFALPFAPVGWQPLDWSLLWPVLGVGVTSVVAQMLLTYALGFVSTATGGVATQLTPAFSWLLGALLLGEPILPLALVGALVCMGGVLWGTGVHLRLFAAAPAPAGPDPADP
ncbi:DMT family transporter [Aggregicoccus sp. 17bor-14]|uniref:DMT family transporter n=1 Tax=Myxococcaceae TaxID=31 RepID=UPI00129C9CA6|nr:MULTISPECIES: DMT family transporter [Myxococcaceae]MBF5041476.1 DMT family transporter [Simulacricoccus sp. 17bor-14]MRI87260.1 DMT family transporter [Aggregicoccus sp. 17bor-14]